MNLKLVLSLFLAGACFAQVATIPNELFPQFRTDLNTSLGNAVAITGSYTNPSWLVSIPYTKVTGMSATAPIVYSGGVFSCAVATGSVPGCISAADWTKFNAATSAGTPIQKGDGAGGFVSSSLTDNGTTVSTTEALSVKSVTTGDATASGGSCFSGFTSGTVCIVSANAASGGTDVAYIMPSTIGTAGQVLKDNGSTTCPTLAAGSPATCHQMVWTTLSTGGAGTVLCSSVTASSTTSSTSEANLQTCTIPAGTLTTSSRVVVNLLYKFVGTTNTKTPVLRLSTTSGDASAGYIFYSTASLAASLARHDYPEFVNNGSLSVQSSGTLGFGNGTVTPTAGAINTANASYINFNCQVANAADSCQILNYMVIVY